MTLEELQAGHVFLINKPVDWTSFDVVNKVRHSIRHKFNIKKIKVGHAGTLDPFATGVLVLCTGKMTKQIDTIVATEKEYISTFRLGAKSDSYDCTGEIEITENAVLPSMEQIKEAISAKFLGEIEQTPPMFSAKKIDGKRLYYLARKGKTVERKAVKITIKEYEVLDYSDTMLKVRIVCSKGTYIRSLAHDLGEYFACGALCQTLERTRVGEYKLSDSLDLKTVVKSIDMAL